MNFNLKKFRTAKLIVFLIAIPILSCISNARQKDLLEFARAHESQPNPYVAKTLAKEIKPDSWDSVYLPSTVPEFYEWGSSIQTDTYISAGFSRPIDYKNETSLDNSYPRIHFTQWNEKKATQSWAKSYLPPILKTGEYQTYGSQTPSFIDDPEDQLKLKMNATLQTKTFNDKEYYFCDKAQNGYPFLLWYEGENTLLLAVEPATGNKAHIEITLDEMLAIADSVEKYN